MRNAVYFFSTLILLLVSTSKSNAQINQPDWAKNALVYQVSVQQFSAEGNFEKFSSSLADLKEIGVTVIAFTPIYSIGEKNKLGNMGDAYSVKDHYSVNSILGGEDEFKTLVQKIHEYGMKVIIDWNTSYTSVDHQWLTAHNNWYLKDENGSLLTKNDRTDIAMLNYGNADLREEILNAMKHWLRKMDVDGFRIKDANYAPIDFWKETIQELKYIKPAFFIAEFNSDVNVKQYAYYAEVFNAINDYAFLNLSTNHAQNITSTKEYIENVKSNYKLYPNYSLRLNSLTEYLYNNQVGTVDELFSNNWQQYAVIAYTLPQSTPMIFNGEEYGLTRRLNVYEKDYLGNDDKQNVEQANWYKEIFSIKRETPAFQNSLIDTGINFLSILTAKSDQSSVFAFTRSTQNSTAYIFVNFGAKATKVKIADTKSLLFLKKFAVNSNAKPILKKKMITMPANSYVIYYK